MLGECELGFHSVTLRRGFGTASGGGSVCMKGSQVALCACPFGYGTLSTCREGRGGCLAIQFTFSIFWRVGSSNLFLLKGRAKGTSRQLQASYDDKFGMKQNVSGCMRAFVWDAEGFERVSKVSNEISRITLENFIGNFGNLHNATQML